MEDADVRMIQSGSSPSLLLKTAGSNRVVSDVVDLLLAKSYYDVALRDFGLSVGALALGQLSREYDPAKRTR